MRWIAIMVLFINQFFCFSQEGNIVQQWDSLRITLKTRADITTDLAIIINMYDKAHADSLFQASNDLSVVIKKMNIPDEPTIKLLQLKNGNLTTQIMKIMMELPDSIMKNEAVMDKIMDFQENENLIDKELHTYNSICEKNNRRELILKNDYAVPNVKF